MFDFTGKVVLITGSGRGVGAGIAKALAKQGATLAINDFFAERADEMVAELQADGHQAVSVPFDVTDMASVSAGIAKIEAAFSSVDVLINNAGALLNKPFAETTMNDFEAVYKVNVFGVAELTRVVLPYMKEGAHVVTVSSMGGVQGRMKFTGLAEYSSSKGAVITWRELLAEGYKEQHIAFNVIDLGAVQTVMLE